jgi:hypothetical protein
VGRKAEARQLLGAIGSAGSSRQAVGGPPGIGKTTLLQSVKAEALQAGYWTTDELVPFYAQDTAELVLGRLLSGTYDAILTARPQTAQNSAMQAAQQLVRVTRLGSGGVNLSVMGFGAGVSRGQAAITPPGAVLLDGPRVIRHLLDLVREAGARGIVLHLDNLENLSERDARNAADVLRGLRDPVLLQDGLHLLLGGTAEAVTAVTGTYAQVRSVFATPLILEPLPPIEVQELLNTRYAHLVLDPSLPPVAPVDPAAVDALYPMFRGDLRSLLKSLDEGAMTLLGVGSRPGVPIPLEELRPALQQRYGDQLSRLDESRRRQLQLWAESGTGTQQTQKTLQQLWNVTQGAASNSVRDLIEEGYVLALPRRGAEATNYVLTGFSRIIFG